MGSPPDLELCQEVGAQKNDKEALSSSQHWKKVLRRLKNGSYIKSL